MNIKTYKANPIHKDETISSATIEINKELPNPKTYQEVKDLYENEGLKLYQCLRDHLPQGTLHNLTELLLENYSKSVHNCISNKKENQNEH